MARVAAARAGARLAAKGAKGAAKGAKKVARKVTAKKTTAASQLKKKYGAGSSGSMTRNKKGSVKKAVKNYVRSGAPGSEAVVLAGGIFGPAAVRARREKKQARGKPGTKTTVSKKVNEPNKRTASAAKKAGSQSARSKKAQSERMMRQALTEMTGMPTVSRGGRTTGSNYSSTNPRRRSR